MSVTRTLVSESLRAALANDPETEVRAEAALALGSLCIGDAAARTALLVALDGIDQRVRVAAATALGGALEHEDVRTALLAVVEQEDVDVAGAALLSLAACSDERGREAALAALDRPELWEAATAALVRSRAHRIIDRLTDVLACSDRPCARRGAARALAGLERRRDQGPWSLNGYDDPDGRWHVLY